MLLSPLIKRLAVSLLLLLAAAGCKSSTEPRDNYEIIAIKFRTFLSFDGVHREPAYLWLTRGNGWKNTTVTPEGDTISIGCLSCPPGIVSSKETGAIWGGRVVIDFRVTGPRMFNDTIIFADARNGSYRAGKPNTEMYIHVMWICTKWNFDHELMCSADQPPP